MSFHLRSNIGTRAALAAACCLTAAASADVISINFENTWPYGDSVANFYAPLGVTFTDNGLGLSNDGLGSNPDGSYFTNAPSPLGTFSPFYFAGEPSARPIMNVTPGATGTFNFWYSSPEAISGAIVAYSGPDGTGDVLGTINLASTFTLSEAGFNYNIWSQASLSFTGTAQSFDFTPAANIASFDDFTLTTIPGPSAAALLTLASLAASRRRRRAV